MTGRRLHDKDAAIGEVAVMHAHAPSRTSGVEIAYEARGAPGAPAILLIAGLGDQLLSWPDAFCERLAAQGFRVVRFDNRDVGLSTSFEEAKAPGLPALVWAYIRGKTLPVPYTLEDMAEDAMGVLDALGSASAHVVGGSLGGMIAQRVAIHHPEHVRTLTLLMSTAQVPGLALPRPRALIVFKTRPLDREGYVEHAVKVMRAVRGGGFRLDEDHVRRQASHIYERAPDSTGIPRQMAAIMTSFNKLGAQAKTITAPTLVIHGSADPVIPVAHGKRLAHLIPGARLVIVKGMGHELPPDAWPIVVDAIAQHVRQGESQSECQSSITGSIS
ncbi:MAG: alpha/beta fold hydrolase [Anaerolineae bacterium]|nr:alpha/beta fold hydrolase [Anaerolineae bacterium]